MLCFNRLQVKTIFNIISHDKGSRMDLSSLACEDDSINKLNKSLLCVFRHLSRTQFSDLKE